MRALINASSCVGSQEKLGLSSYGVQSTSLEEVFLYLASHSSVLDAAEDAVPPHEHEHRRSNSSTARPEAPQASSGDANASATATATADGGMAATEGGRSGSDPTAVSAAAVTRETRAASMSASALNPTIVDTYVAALTEGVHPIWDCDYLSRWIIIAREFVYINLHYCTYRVYPHCEI